MRAIMTEPPKIKPDAMGPNFTEFNVAMVPESMLVAPIEDEYGEEAISVYFQDKECDACITLLFTKDSLQSVISELVRAFTETE